MILKGWFERGKRRLNRYFVHRQNNEHILALADWVTQNAPRTEGAPIVFFNASTRLSGMSLNAAFALLTGWALRLSGTRLLHYVCEGGMSRCVLGTRRTDPHLLPPCKECTCQSDIFFRGGEVYRFKYLDDPTLSTALKDVDVESLQNFEVESVPLGNLVLPSVRWVLRRYKLVDDENTRFLYREFILSAWGIVQEFKHFCAEHQPRLVVVFNGIAYPEAAVRWIALQRGIRVVTHEVCHQPFSAFFSNDEATAYSIQVPDDFELSNEQNDLLDAYLSQRYKGNFSMAGIRFWGDMQALSPAFWEKAGSFNQIVPVFTNVIFDTSQTHSNVLFEHMFAWLERVVQIIRAHPETLFVLRAHPDETRPGKESQESVAEWVLRNGLDQLPNVLFVQSQEYISSYELIQHSKFVMLYNSTIGLEAALMGAAVLCAGKARFTQLPMVFFPKSLEEYGRTVEEFLTCERVQVPVEFLRNARRFMFTNLYRASLPFDGFLETDGVWAGYVRFKEFDPSMLLPGKSTVLDVIRDGILLSKPFWMPESYENDIQPGTMEESQL